MCRQCKITLAYLTTTLALFALAICLVTSYVPTESTMGPIQKIFYLHLPVAIATFFACLICFAASIAYALQRDMKWDRLASAAARVAVIFCSVVLLTGMIWGRSAWGQWWTWSPRLTFSLVLWLLYVVYVMVRASVESPQRRAIIAAVYGIIAFLDVPLVWLSVRLMPDIHPVSVELAGSMKLTLLAWFVPVFMLMFGLIALRFRIDQQAAEDAKNEQPDRQIAAPARMNWAAGSVL